MEKERRQDVRSAEADAEINVQIHDEFSEQQQEAMAFSHSTFSDAMAMKRMGKKQQLIRNFRLLSLTSFGAIATASWEIGLFVLTPGLVDGGLSGMCWSMVWVFIAYCPIYLSLAEMASMAPIAGAQYHWVSEFAPESYQRILSYFTGWTSTIAWQAGNAQGIFLVGSLIQTVILINNENYAFPAWHGALLAMASACIAYIGVVYGAKVLPYWQNAIFVVHILGWLAYIIPVWVVAPAATHEQVWFSFENSGGWQSKGLAVLVGQLTAFGLIAGIDTGTHMTEELQDASISIPRSIMSLYVINIVMMVPIVLTVAYHIVDLDAALNDSTTYPAIYVLRQTMSTTWITVFLAVTLFLGVASNIAYLAAVTRDLFAFGRDKGFPFSNWLSRVNGKHVIPVNATIFSTVTAMLLSCIYIGSPVAFYAIVSLSTVSFLQCYCLSIGCLLWRRIRHPETIPPARFSLGRWGVPLNAWAVVMSFYAFFWAFWPQVTPVTAAGFNWAGPIFVATLIVATAYFFYKGKRDYLGPVLEVEGRMMHRG